MEKNNHATVREEHSFCTILFAFTTSTYWRREREVQEAEVRESVGNFWGVGLGLVEEWRKMRMMGGSDLVEGGKGGGWVSEAPLPLSSYTGCSSV